MNDSTFEKFSLLSYKVKIAQGHEYLSQLIAFKCKLYIKCRAKSNKSLYIFNLCTFCCKAKHYFCVPVIFKVLNS